MAMEMQSIICPKLLSLSSIRGVTSFFLFCPSFLKCHRKYKFFTSSNYSTKHRGVKEVSLRAFDDKDLITECQNGPGNGKELSGELYNHIICACCKVGDIDKAMALLAQMEALGFRPNLISYIHLIEALGSIGRTSEAEAVFQEMICSGFKPRVKMYNVLLRVFLKKGLLRVAVKILEVMGDLGIHKNQETYEVLVDYYVNAGRLEVLGQ